MNSMEEIRRLAKLKDSGAINQVEFESIKATILAIKAASDSSAKNFELASEKVNVKFWNHGTVSLLIFLGFALYYTITYGAGSTLSEALLISGIVLGVYLVVLYFSWLIGGKKFALVYLPYVFIIGSIVLNQFIINDGKDKASSNPDTDERAVMTCKMCKEMFVEKGDGLGDGLTFYYKGDNGGCGIKTVYGGSHYGFCTEMHCLLYQE